MRLIALIAIISSAPAQEDPAQAIPFEDYSATMSLSGEAAAIAIDAGGRILVAARGMDAIHLHDSSGRFLGAWGGDGRERLPLEEPRGLAIAANGDLYLVDSLPPRVLRVGPRGSLKSSWGRHGSAPGEFRDPRGIAADSRRVAVADAGNHRVQVFDLDGSFLFAAGGHGSGAGDLSRPGGVAVGDEGRIYVADTGNHRIQVFDREGRHLRSWGDYGSFPGLLASPGELAWHRGRLYVVDTGNHRIQVFAGDGKLLYRWGTHTVRPHEGEGRLHYPASIAIAPTGGFAVVGEPFENRCQVFLRRGEGRQRYDPGASWRQVQVTSHYGMRLDMAGDLLAIPEPDRHSITVLQAHHPEPIIIGTFGEPGPRCGQISHPTDVAIDLPRRRVIVADGGNRRLQVFELDWEPGAPPRYRPGLGRFVKSLSFEALALRMPELAGRPVVEPAAVALGPGGEIFLLDSSSARVEVLSGELEHSRGWGGYGVEAGRFRDPTDLALSPRGDLVYVVDSGNRRIQGFDPEGRHLFEWGAVGRREERFQRPFGIAADAAGFTYITDVEGHAVVKMDPQGQVVARWGGRGIGPGEFFKPKGVVIDELRGILVDDHGNHRAQRFSPEGELLAIFGSRPYVKAARFPGARREGAE